MRYLLIIGMVLISFAAAKAQYKFNDESSSEKYNAKITVEKTENALCFGKGTITLFDKIENKTIQSFSSDNLEFSLLPSQDNLKEEINLGKYQSPIIFGDFNFDGHEDIAIRNGTNTNYHAPAYQVYLFNSSKNKFVLNTEFSKLASNNLGMFTVDRKKKQLTASQKEGCCYYKDLIYKVQSNNKLLMVANVVEDATVGDNVTVISQELINGKMKTTVQTYKVKDYYKQ